VNLEKTIETTFSEAIKMAKERGEDLIQVGYDQNNNYAICHITELGKYKYNLQKKQKPQQSPEVKEFRFGLNISEHDIDTKLKHASELMFKKHPIKIVVFLKNWQKPQFSSAVELFNKIKTKLGNTVISQSYKEQEKSIAGVFVHNNKQ